MSDDFNWVIMAINPIKHVKCSQEEYLLLNGYINKNTKRWDRYLCRNWVFPLLFPWQRQTECKQWALSTCYNEDLWGINPRDVPCDNKHLTLKEILISRDRACISLFSLHHLGLTIDSQPPHSKRPWEKSFLSSHPTLWIFHHSSPGWNQQRQGIYESLRERQVRSWGHRLGTSPSNSRLIPRDTYITCDTRGAPFQTFL